MCSEAAKFVLRWTQTLKHQNTTSYTQRTKKLHQKRDDHSDVMWGMELIASENFVKQKRTWW